MINKRLEDFINNLYFDDEISDAGFISLNEDVFELIDNSISNSDSYKLIIDLLIRLVCDYSVIENSELFNEYHEKYLAIFKKLKRLDSSLGDYIYDSIIALANDDYSIDYYFSSILEIFKTKKRVDNMLRAVGDKTMSFCIDFYLDRYKDNVFILEPYIKRALVEDSEALLLLEGIQYNHKDFLVSNFLYDNEYIYKLRDNIFASIVAMELGLRLSNPYTNDLIILEINSIVEERLKNNIFNIKIGLDKIKSSKILNRVRAYLANDIATLVELIEDDLANMSFNVIYEYHKLTNSQLFEPLYLKLFINIIDRSKGDRGAYSRICGDLETIVREIDITLAMDIMDELRKKYKTRKALIDELNYLDNAMDKPYFYHI